MEGSFNFHSIDHSLFIVLVNNNQPTCLSSSKVAYWSSYNERWFINGSKPWSNWWSGGLGRVRQSVRSSSRQRLQGKPSQALPTVPCNGGIDILQGIHQGLWRLHPWEQAEDCAFLNATSHDLQSHYERSRWRRWAWCSKTIAFKAIWMQPNCWSLSRMYRNPVFNQYYKAASYFMIVTFSITITS